ncbi:type II toxin-antitoxin system RelE/ParE family toxin, partial [Salmonella enterica]|nr:type II toxin-antitoxin system RelE/ParE family toxin [Salmonella enterica]
MKLAYRLILMEMGGHMFSVVYHPEARE